MLRVDGVPPDTKEQLQEAARRLYGQANASLMVRSLIASHLDKSPVSALPLTSDQTEDTVRVELRLPDEVRRQGVQVNKAQATFLVIVVLTSKSGKTDTMALGNFSNTRVVDELRRVSGVGDVISFSPPYAMRIWLDPDKLANYRMSVADALSAVREQNSQTPGGSLGDQPLAPGAGYGVGDQNLPVSSSRR